MSPRTTSRPTFAAPIAISRRRATFRSPNNCSARRAAILRDKFLSADIGVTGANFLVAETGTSIIVTNEGNGDLTQILPKVHVVVASLEKIVPTLADAAQLLRVLARSATGQDMSVYTTLSTGPRRPGDPDGPEEYHVVLLDNGRSAMLGSEFEDMLRCIRCGACMNHCPVYHAIGGHAYGWVYPGPMGAVLTPSLIGVAEGGQLPNASTFCGRCEAVCPVRIPLPKMMRHWREREFERHLSPAAVRSGARRLGVLRQAPDALSPDDRSGDARDASGRPRARALLLAAVRRRLDPIPRLDGAAGRDLSKPMARQKRERAMSARDEILKRRPPLAACDGRRGAAPRGGGGAPRAGPGGNHSPSADRATRGERAATFKAEAERAQASLAEVADAADVPAEVARFLRENNLAATLRMGEDARLGRDALGRDRARSLARALGRA